MHLSYLKKIPIPHGRFLSKVLFGIPSFKKYTIHKLASLRPKNAKSLLHAQTLNGGLNSLNFTLDDLDFHLSRVY